MHCTYHQPWNLAEAEISPHVKGWVLDGDSPMLSFPSLQQVLLIPDSLAFERDTLQAPISAGHALRIGGSWERLSSAKWHLGWFHDGDSPFILGSFHPRVIPQLEGHLAHRHLRSGWVVGAGFAWRWGR